MWPNSNRLESKTIELLFETLLTFSMIYPKNLKKDALLPKLLIVINNFDENQKDDSEEEK
jgi:hypothetical protein